MSGLGVGRDDMITRDITYFGKACTLACDALCIKAWGSNSRPRIAFDDGDDYALLADSELGTAPDDPETYEGADAKPTCAAERLNRWCARECERSVIVNRGAAITLPDLSRRLYNMPWLHLDGVDEGPGAALLASVVGALEDD